MSESVMFSISPRLVRADREAGLVITADDPALLADGAECTVTVYPMESGPECVQRVTARGGALRLRQYFPGEQEHLIHVDHGAAPLGDVRVYSLADDLYALRPYKGDLHMHSNRSDGMEPPAHVAAACRRIGLDFMALTDHRQYAPSLEAIQAFAGVPVDLAMFPGEEIHPPPHCPVHIVNFGGAFSVNALCADEPAYLAEVQAIEATLDDPALQRDARRYYAQCLWTYRKIREAGGLSIFCHPYWITGRRYNVSEALIARHFADRPFDAYEVIGGYYRSQAESNLLQVARYHEERGRGNALPIVGVSDAHGCESGELFGWYCTLVFAPSMAFADLTEAIRDRRAVAVEALPGEAPRAHGPFRLVKYAQFLLREVFPAHDALCREEGAWMLAHLAGEAEAAGQLAVSRGRTAALLAREWGEL